MDLKILDGTYQVVKLKINDKLLDDIFNQEFCSVTKTDEEISVVADDKINMLSDNAEKGWKIIKIMAVLDFSLIGVISNISKILADAEVGIFVVSTYNTDYILIKEQKLDKAKEVLTKNNYCFK